MKNSVSQIKIINNKLSQAKETLYDFEAGFYEIAQSEKKKEWMQICDIWDAQWLGIWIFAILKENREIKAQKNHSMK